MRSASQKCRRNFPIRNGPRLIPSDCVQDKTDFICPVELTLINCLGVRAGSGVQNGLMVLKICAIAALVIGGLAIGASHLASVADTPERRSSGDLLRAAGAAPTPIANSSKFLERLEDPNEQAALTLTGQDLVHGNVRKR